MNVWVDGFMYYCQNFPSLFSAPTLSHHHAQYSATYLCFFSITHEIAARTVPPLVHLPIFNITDLQFFSHDTTMKTFAYTAHPEMEVNPCLPDLLFVFHHVYACLAFPEVLIALHLPMHSNERPPPPEQPLHRI